MPITTWANIPKETNITDEDIKYLFEEVSKINKDWRIVEEKKIIKKLFRKPVEKKLYALYLDVGHGEHQVFGLGHEEDDYRTMTAPANKQVIMAWLLGFLHAAIVKITPYGFSALPQEVKDFMTGVEWGDLFYAIEFKLLEAANEAL